MAWLVLGAGLALCGAAFAAYLESGQGAYAPVLGAVGAAIAVTGALFVWHERGIRIERKTMKLEMKQKRRKRSKFALGLVLVGAAAAAGYYLFTLMG
jgi:O-antigen/teichoic acid export membrane protein